jgi:uncharacterized protein YutE (UPF0331/DUF86 family)
MCSSTIGCSLRDQSLDRIDAVMPDDRNHFLSDRTAQEVVSFNLFVAFQDALDLAAHLIADHGLELPTTARAHFEILARASLLTPAIAQSMAACAGLRNLIAHAYGSVDLGRLHDELPHGRDALAAYCAEVAAQI